MAAATKVISLRSPSQAIPRKTKRSPMAFLSPEEVLAVLKTARARSVRDWAMVLVHIDAWLKDVAPSTALHQWFSHDPKKWDEFWRRYRRELGANPDTVVRASDVTACLIGSNTLQG